MYFGTACVGYIFYIPFQYESSISIIYNVHYYTSLNRYIHLCGLVHEQNNRRYHFNNRNLKTMEIDLATTEELAPIIGEHNPDRIIISESGILTPQDATRVVRAGADAVLVGTSIMKGDIYENTRLLVEAGWMG